MFYHLSNDWINELKNNTHLIYDELKSFLQHNAVKISAEYTHYVSQGNWETVPLIFFTIQNHQFLDQFPQLQQLLTKIPELIGAEFSRLHPHTIIKPHVGYSKQVMRTHLCLKSEKGDMGLKCGQETHTWLTGQTFSFNDGLLHEAWNKTDQERWVLMIDTPIPNSPYSARDIAKYKLKNLTDENLLKIASKNQWLDWLKN